MQCKGITIILVDFGDGRPLPLDVWWCTRCLYIEQFFWQLMQSCHRTNLTSLWAKIGSNSQPHPKVSSHFWHAFSPLFQFFISWFPFSSPWIIHSSQIPSASPIIWMSLGYSRKCYSHPFGSCSIFQHLKSSRSAKKRYIIMHTHTHIYIYIYII